jgi:pimeloyl-ACP methyl ester carboxylesterase
MNANPAANIVLVHGGFVDGSGWRPLYHLLTRDGYHVAVVQNPTLSLQGDAAATRLIIYAQDGPVVLVGHFYGGAVISEAGTDPNVAALVRGVARGRDDAAREASYDADARALGRGSPEGMFLRATPT